MKKIIFAFLLLSFISNLIGQNTPKAYHQIEINSAFIKDTLSIDKYLKKALEPIVSTTDSSQFYFKKATELANKTQSIEQIAKVNFQEGKYFYNNYKFFDAIKKYNKTILLLEKVKDTKRLSLLYLKLGQSYAYTFNSDIALKYYSKSLDFYKRNNNKIGEANCYNEIGNLYYNKNYDISVKYYTKALRIYIKNGNWEGIATTYINLANAVSDNGNIKQGIVFYYKAMNALNKKKDNYNLSIVYNNLGDSYKSLKKYDKAIILFEKSLSISKHQNLSDINTMAFYNIAETKYEQGLYNEAILYANKSINYSLDIINQDLLNMNYLILSNAYEKKNELETAIKYKNKYIENKDRENKNNNIKKAQLYQNISELEKSQFAINKLTVQNEKNNLTLEFKRDLTYFLIFITLMLTVFIIILFIQQKEKRKVHNLMVIKTDQISIMNDRIQAQNDYLNNLNQTKNKLLKIIAHDLKNPLSSIEGFTDLMIQSDDGDFDQKEKHSFLVAIKESATKASVILNDLLKWAIEHEKPLINKNVCIYKMINEELKLLEIQALQKKIKIENLVEENITITTDTSKLGTIIRNLISNAIKFTPTDGEISIYSEINSAFLKITIKDNGIGISNQDLEKLFNVKSKKSKRGTNNEEGSGLGLDLCKEFIEILGGELTANSVLNEGSSFSFTIPLH